MTALGKLDHMGLYNQVLFFFLCLIFVFIFNLGLISQVYL